MKRITLQKCYITFILALFYSGIVSAESFKSIHEFGIKPGNSPEINKVHLQKAIDWASQKGEVLYIEPSKEPYHISGGLILKKNVSLIGIHGPTPRGTVHNKKKQPVGSVFKITDTENVFITVETGTQIKGVQFWYSEQTTKNPAAIIPYKATIQVSKTSNAQGIFMSCLTFYGEYLAFDFNANKNHPCELMTFEHCYGFPLSGEFIRINYCYDIPRLLHCHLNPAIQRYIGGQYSKVVVDEVIAKKTYAYTINHTDNAQLIDIFTFGTYGGILLGPANYGQLTNFNLDCVAVGIYKTGDNKRNRNWMISQGSIIANTGEEIENVHPIIIEGMGHTSLTNVEAFSGGNGALSNVGGSHDFMLVRGNEDLTISMVACRMKNYQAENPITNLNKHAKIQAVACFDKSDKPLEIGE